MAKEEKKRKHKEHKEHKEKSSKSHKKSKKTSPEDSVKESTKVIHVATPITAHSSFSQIEVKLYLHLAPLWANNPMEGITEQLNAFMMKYVPEVDGIVLAHSDTRLVNDKGIILNESPFCHFYVRVKFLVWKPRKNTRLVGQINLQSQDHIGLLIFGTFNASIPRARIPSDKYEWRAFETPVEATPTEKNEEEDEDSEESEENAEENSVMVGRKRSKHGEWVVTSTGEALGGNDGIVEFNVVDIIEANDILTVTGSL
ncbi:hypothetical protein BCR43DRAFT_496220 [Syncephalastrum racemosum]|uniref:Uncharacterized protein n=1 Tax=Syncephalastrum racemosum TaxID=13706 RepID=A0A1X2H3R6_SYNRA|nr:hypothetical protein BCR43DRAFT_496220 [Syncephalastrum racemosum]